MALIKSEALSGILATRTFVAYQNATRSVDTEVESYINIIDLITIGYALCCEAGPARDVVIAQHPTERIAWFFIAPSEADILAQAGTWPVNEPGDEDDPIH